MSGARGFGLAGGAVAVLVFCAIGALIGVFAGDAERGFLVGAWVALPLLLVGAAALIVKGLRSGK